MCIGVCGNEFSLESTLDVCVELESSNRSVVASGGGPSMPELVGSATRPSRRYAPAQLACARHDAAFGSALCIDATGSTTAVGSTTGLCIFDVEWPWEPSRWLPSVGEVVALDWRGNEALHPIEASAVEQGVALYDLERRAASQVLWSHGKRWGSVWMALLGMWCRS